MALPTKQDLTLYRGDTYRQQVTLWADAEETQPIDLTGAAAKAEIRDRAAGKLIATIACTVTPPNVVDLDLSAAVTGALTGKGVWDLQITYPGGDVRTLLAGAVKITTDVTDSAPAAAPALQVVK